MQVNEISGEKKSNPWFAVFSDFCSINGPTMANFRLPKGVHWMQNLEDIYYICVCIHTHTHTHIHTHMYIGFPGGSEGKESSCNARDPGSILGLGRSPGEGNGYPFQHSCLENPMDRGAWRATVHGGSQRVRYDWMT